MFSNREFKALEKHWGYSTYYNLEEFLVSNFQREYIHFFHDHLSKRLDEFRFIGNDGGPNAFVIVPEYVRATDYQNEIMSNRIGQTNYVVKRNNYPNSNYLLFSIMIGAEYDRNIEKPVICLYLYIPSFRDEWICFARIGHFASNIFFDGLINLKPRFDFYHMVKMANKYIVDDFKGLMDVIITSLIYEEFDLGTAINLLFQYGPEYWSLDAIRGLIHEMAFQQQGATIPNDQPNEPTPKQKTRPNELEPDGPIKSPYLKKTEEE